MSIRSALLEAAFERLGNAEMAWLATNSQNTPAIGFYLAQGVRQVGETDFRIGDQAYLNNVCLCRLSWPVPGWHEVRPGFGAPPAQRNRENPQTGPAG